MQASTKNGVVAISRQVIDEIAHRANIVDIIGEYVPLHQKGNRYWGLSPFSDEKTPSFSVSPDKGLYYCFSTSKGGTIFTFIMEMENISFPQAVELLGRKVGVEVHSDPEDGRRYQMRSQLQDLYTRVARSFHHILTESKGTEHVRQYLRQRGINDETCKRFGVGYAPPDPGWLYRFLHSKEYSDDFLAESKLFSTHIAKRCLFVDRIMFPIRNEHGETIGFGGRALTDIGPKYINSPESELFSKKHTLFGLSEAREQARSTQRLYLVEGYIDVLAMHQAGYTNTVSASGTAFGITQARLVRRYAKKECCIVFDGDKAGMQAATRAMSVLEGAGIVPLVCVMPMGRDPADIYVTDGIDRLQSLLQDAIVESIDYLLIQFILDSDHISRKQNLVFETIFPYISSMRSETRREHCLQRVADKLGVDRHRVINDFESGKRETKKQSEQKTSSGEQIIPLYRQELYLMIAAIAEPWRFEYIRSLIGVGELRDNEARSLYIAAEEWYRNGEQSLESLCSRLEDRELRELIIKNLATEAYTNLDRNSILGIVHAIKCATLRIREEKCIRLLRQSQRDSSDLKKERELQQEIMYLNTEIKKLRVEMDV